MCSQAKRRLKRGILEATFEAELLRSFLERLHCSAACLGGMHRRLYSGGCASPSLRDGGATIGSFGMVSVVADGKGHEASGRSTNSTASKRPAMRIRFVAPGSAS